MKKKNRKRKSWGWAKTKSYPHERHPAHYRKTGDDEISYLTFTHSPVVEYRNGNKVKTIPMNDNVSERERGENKRFGRKRGENISYVYPRVFKGKRSALGTDIDDYSFVDEDKKYSDKLFKDLPVEYIPKTGGKGQYKKRKTKKPRK